MRTVGRSFWIEVDATAIAEDFTSLSSPVFSWVRMSSTPGTARASVEVEAVDRGPCAIALVTRKAKAGLAPESRPDSAPRRSPSTRIEARRGLAHVVLRFGCGDRSSQISMAAA